MASSSSMSALKIPGLHILERLGGGGFSQVFSAVTIPPPDSSAQPARVVAVKVLSEPLNEESEEDLQREVSIWSFLSEAASRFPTIDTMPVVPMYGLYATEGGNEKHLCISMRLCTGGSLADALDKKGTLSEGNAMAIAHTLARALDMCHDLRIVHMDLKPDNVLFPCAASSEACRGALLADFGLSQSLPGDASYVLVGRGAGTSGFQAPEVITDGLCSPAADSWSLGALLLLVLTGRLPPFAVSCDPDSLLPEFQRWDTSDPSLSSWLDGYLRLCPRWYALSQNAKDAIKGLLCPSIPHRLTPRQLLHHPWLTVEQLAYRQYLADTTLTTGTSTSMPSSCANIGDAATVTQQHWALAAN